MAKNNGLAQAAAAAKAFCAALALLAAVMVARAVQVEDMQASIAPCRESDDDYIAARGNASQRLAEAVRFQTSASPRRWFSHGARQMTLWLQSRMLPAN